MIEFRVLGPLEAEADGTTVALQGRRLRALLTALLLEPGNVMPIPRLVDALWGERPPDAATNALHQVVSRLRTKLGAAGDLVRTRPPGYLLYVDDASIDAGRFEARFRAARGAAHRGDPRQAAALVDEALALWRGPAYGEFAEEFARPQAVRLEEIRLTALEERAAYLLEAGLPADAIAGARDAHALNPLRPRPVEVLMLALHADGRTSESLDVYRGYRTALSDEMGLDPPPDLRELEAQILQDVPLLPRGRRTRATTTAAAAPEADQEPAAPTTADVSRLPWLPSPILGRGQDLDLLLGCLHENRLLTLLGPGGVGKTRLAMEAAHRLASRGTPAWWVDLSAISGERLVDVIADAAGIEVPRGADAIGTLSEALRTRSGVLFLDNAETVLAELAPLVEQLAHAAPYLAIVSTSRERLALDTEHVHVLAPLPLPTGGDPTNPAIQLFLRRAPGLEPDELGEEELTLIGQLCRRLDGLPLAIELGAARVPVFGLRELVAQVSQGLDVLAGGRRTAVARHRTLRAVVDWSHSLLMDDEARLLARLTVFPGVFSVQQAAAVCADEWIADVDVPPLLARLVEQSMVQAGGGRFWLLETLRTYAAERLEPAELQVLAQRHAEHTAATLGELRLGLGSDQEPRTVVAIAALIPDLHVAWEHAREQDRALAVQLAADVLDYAYQRQRRDLLEWGLAVSGWDVEHPRLPAALTAAACSAWIGGRFTEAADLAARGLAVATTAGQDSPAAAGPLVQLANLAMFGGRTEEARSHYSRAAELMANAGMQVGVMMAQISISQVLVYEGRLDEAATRMRDLLEQARASGMPSAIAWAHFVSGEAAADIDPDAARASYQAAIEVGSTVDNRLFVNLARTAAMGLTARHGPAASALDEINHLMEQWEDLRNEAGHWWVLLYLAELLVRIGHERDGAVLSSAVLSSRQRHWMLVPDESRLQENLRLVREALGDPATEEALAIGSRMPYAEAVAFARAAIDRAREQLPRP